MRPRRNVAGVATPGNEELLGEWRLVIEMQNRVRVVGIDFAGELDAGLVVTGPGDSVEVICAALRSFGSRPAMGIVITLEDVRLLAPLREALPLGSPAVFIRCTGSGASGGHGLVLDMLRVLVARKRGPRGKREVRAAQPGAEAGVA